ncbi:hypothetical protein CVT26_012633 [Gymnopilus dilepis]|uniref:BRCT domain-containing protein n=1 Tax=Gymnopilus dilepis TaxID=231916 RepID=A0A409YW34_9AGAR|nr:hypothetical protein CVT26_012633 [Gymnopilus dilepis]
MDSYFPVVAKSTSIGCRKSRPSSGNDRDKKPSHGISNFTSASNITKDLLTTLSHTSNPITHSDIYERTDHIVSFSTGHQVSEGRRKTVHSEDRRSKLHAQQGQASKEAGVLKNTKIYVNGYLESTTDIEIKRLITQAGGTVMYSASQSTHIVTSRPLSGSKTEKLLTKRKGPHLYVIKPEWVLDSIATGRRLPERGYSVTKLSYGFL